MSEILSKKEIEQFILSGFVRIEHAFSKETADAVLDILWNDLPYERSNPQTWTEPVIRLGMYTQQPFIESLNTKKIHLIFDQLVGRLCSLRISWTSCPKGKRCLQRVKQVQFIFAIRF